MPHDFWQYIALLGLGIAYFSSAVAHHIDAQKLATVSAQLMALQDVIIGPRCRVCGCTNDEACLSGCWWEEDDLCSSCSDDQVSGVSSLEGGRR